MRSQRVCVLRTVKDQGLGHMVDQHFEVGVKRKKKQRRLGKRDQ